MIGGGGNDTAFGESGPDRLLGGFGDDTLHGNGDNDVLRAGQGVDVLYGGFGNDFLRAGGPRDVHPGPGGDQVGDTLNGEGGDDRFRTRDGEVDRITCGDGFDRAVVDRVDVITDGSAQSPNGSCERVNRRHRRR